jgi:hypothetical protein
LYIVVVAMRPWPGSSGSCSRFPAASELGPVHMQNCISMISRKERQVLGRKSVGAIFFPTPSSSRSWLPASTTQRYAKPCLCSSPIADLSSHLCNACSPWTSRSILSKSVFKKLPESLTSLSTLNSHSNRLLLLRSHTSLV